MNVSIHMMASSIWPPYNDIALANADIVGKTTLAVASQLITYCTEYRRSVTIFLTYSCQT